MFELKKTDAHTRARRGRLELGHGPVETPVFMPVGTYGTVRGLSHWELESTGAPIMLCNTYHLIRRPGADLIERMGGLHRFNSWPKNILTDSGGFQVFSLAKNSKLTEEGVKFQDPIDGQSYFLTPESVVAAQESFGSDIMMVLDQCPPGQASEEVIKEAVDRSSRWAARAKKAQTRDDLKLFPIVQGGRFSHLRERSWKQLEAIEKELGPWPGVALGGFSVGEEKKDFVESLHACRDLLPTDRPRYLMGVGTPKDLVFAVSCGVDMFDCVIPSRNARHGIVMTREGRMNLRNEIFKEDLRPIDESLNCPASQNYSRAFVRHLLMMGEPLGQQIATYHNVAFFVNFMAQIRRRIEEGSFSDFAADFLASPDQVYLGRERGFDAYPAAF